MSTDVLDRDHISKDDTWDLESLYSDIEQWEEDYSKVIELAEDFTKHSGNFIKSSSSLLKALKDRDSLLRKIENVYVYTHLLLDQDTRNNSSQALADKSMNLYVIVGDKTSFFLPELLQLEEEQIDRYLYEESNLSVYRQFLDNILRQKSHVLSTREESILAQISEVGAASEKTFSMLNNADLKFPIIEDDKNKKIEITHGNFIPLMESKNRIVRENAFKALYGTYKKFENTFTSTLNGEIKNNIFVSKLRKYNTTREASLSGNNIPLAVYDNLIESVHNNLNVMHKYMDIRKKVLELEELHMYDIYTPIVKDFDFHISYEDSVKLINKALEPLGEDYIANMKMGFESRWVDVYENRGKRSGAYSSGSYDSKPFILLNYHDTLDNLFTVAHEMGHSMHSFYTRKYQPYIYGDYSIFVAEVASTVNEVLLLNYMIDNATNKQEKLYLINHYLESFRTTVFRQTMFAEFEMIINEQLEKGNALTGDFLSKKYRELNELYYGPNVTIDEEIGIEWARIPHFYYNFYVYQYATGFSAAVDLTQKILTNDNNDVDKYLNFLKSGSSNYPINILQRAGVDMTTQIPVDNAMQIFGQLVDEFSKLI